ncbi:unnamed protein product [Oreochromis niloticus]|nr:unnamed protein product [Mustela putorius furo]
MEEGLVRAAIPRELVDVLGVEPQSSFKAKAFTEAFLKNSIQQPRRHDLQNMLSHKAVILGYGRPKKERRKSAKARGLNARQKRELKVFQIKPEHQRYELFLPLHELWRQYIIDLCGGLKATSGAVQVSVLCGDVWDSGARVQTRLQDHHQRRQTESDPKEEQRVCSGDQRLRLAHLRQQV